MAEARSDDGGDGGGGAGGAVSAAASAAGDDDGSHGASTPDTIGTTSAAKANPSHMTNVVLSTSPMCPATHWRQDLLLLDDFMDLSSMAGHLGRVRVGGELAMLKHPQYPRHYMVKMKVVVDPLSGSGATCGSGVVVNKTFALWRTFDEIGGGDDVDYDGDDDSDSGDDGDDNDSESGVNDSDASGGGGGGGGDNTDVGDGGATDDCNVLQSDHENVEADPEVE